MHSRELPVEGMDCAGCARSVQSALEGVPGVTRADVRLMAEKAVVEWDEGASADDDALDDALRQAVERAGFRVPADGPPAGPDSSPDSESTKAQTRRSMGLLAAVAALVLALAIVGHGLGVFEWIQQTVPWPVSLAATLLLGYPVFKKVAAAAGQRSVTAHTLMTVGVVAALVVGEWVTAFVIVVFMRIGDYVEGFTTDQARESVRALVREAPQTARVERDGGAEDVPIGDVRPSDVVIVRPGEKIPVDGTVIDGQATINQAAITGESMPVEAAAGSEVYAATIAQGGHLRIRTEHAGADTTFGRVIQMVEEAEAHQGATQRWADRFTGYYLPVVGGAAGLTYFVSGDVLATVAVLVVACSCAFALATPVAMLASIGTAARDGLLVKGGRYLEALAQADVLLLDKTGTLTLGTPQITAIRPLDGLADREILRLAASAERYSEHPLAAAIRQAADARGIEIHEPDRFEALPGRGIRAEVEGRRVTVGNETLVDAKPTAEAARTDPAHTDPAHTPLWMAVDGTAVGVLLAADTERSGLVEALDAIRAIGPRRIEMLTGDREETAAALADRLGLDYRAELLPQDKIDIVRAHQAAGRTVVMIGDGVNDAPALAQADAGIAMGAVGTDVAIDAAHVVLMREDWALVPLLFRTANRTMRVVKGNFVFTGVYNLLALGLAAVGWLPPVVAAAMHSIPDLGILANSSRLLRRSDS